MTRCGPYFALICSRSAQDKKGLTGGAGGATRRLDQKGDGTPLESLQGSDKIMLHLSAKWELETKHRGGREATEEKKRRRRRTGLPGHVREKERLDNGSGVKAKLPMSSVWGRITAPPPPPLQGLSSGARGQGERGKVRPEGGSENQQEPRALKTPLQSFSAPSLSGLPSSQPPPARPLTE